MHDAGLREAVLRNVEREVGVVEPQHAAPHDRGRGCQGDDCALLRYGAAHWPPDRRLK